MKKWHIKPGAGILALPMWAWRNHCKAHELFPLVLALFLLLCPISSAFAAISHIGAGAADTNNGGCPRTVTPEIPSGNVDDVLVALAVAREESATVAASAGWTTLYSDNYAGQEFRVYIFYRIATGADTLTITESGTCDSLAARVSRFRGVDTASPFLNVPIPSGNVVNQNTDYIDTGTETTIDADAMLLVASFVNDNNGITQGAGWSASFESALNLNRDMALNLHYQLQTTAGAKSISNWGINNTDENFGIIFSLRPSTLPTGVINTYYPGSTASVAAGATSITLGAAIGSTTPIAIGDTLLILQMQDASLNSTNTDAYGDGTSGDLTGRGTTGVGGSGLYEYAIAASNVPIAGGVLTLACGTNNAYTNAAATGTSGQKKYQVIRVPKYDNTALSSSLTARAWNGSVGGVLAFDVTGALALGSATVNVNGLGFRGGATTTQTTGSGNNTDYRTPVSNNANGSKGEGIAGTPRYVYTSPDTRTDTGVEGYPNGSRARGAPGNAGGGATDRNPAANDENPGGGGGGNGGVGGIGGIGWCPGFTNTAPYYGCGLATQASALNLGGSTGGFGGVAVSGLGATRLTLGGGGGGGTANNVTGSGACATVNGLCSSGVAGGGIIMIRAGSMTGSATFNANGSAGDDTVGNDGSGGGGAGGAVLISAGSGMGGVTINVAGGKGGDNLVSMSSNPHGPGGGGGGGYAITTSATASCSASGGANGVTYRNGTLFGAYGAMSGGSGSCITGLTAAQIPGTLLGASGCGPSIDHYELSLPSNGVTCLATTATVTACSDNSSPCTSPLTTISGQTATLATTAGTLGSTTVTFNASGVASTTLSYPAAADGAGATVTLSGEQTAATNPRKCCPDGTSCVVASNCSTTFNTAGFVFSTLAGGAVATIPNQIAGVSDATYYLRAVKTNTTTQACESALTGANTVNFAYECNDPATCYGANLMNINGSVAGDGGWGAATTIARNNNGSVSSYTSVNMTFNANGNAPFTFIYSDVGQVTLHASKAAGGTLLSALIGSSNAFVVKPYDFEVIPCNALVGGICDTAPADPGIAGGGSVFAKAGAAFNATVTARAFSGAATPSFGAGSNNGTETVNLTRTRVAPIGVGAVDGALGGTTAIPRSSFSNGIATVSDLSWSEVGVITLTATNSTFLGNALTTTGVTGNLGRFVPDHFDVELVSASGVPMPCNGLTCPTNPLGQSGFAYSGQPFSVQVTAKSMGVGGSTTQNYQGVYARAVTLSAWDALGSIVTQDPPSGSDTLGGGSITAATFASGVAVTATPTYTFNTVPTVPTDIYVRATDDADGVSSRIATLPSSSVEPGLKIVSGRIKVSNAYGSELLPLRLQASAQYFTAIGWVNSIDDDVTDLNVAASYAVGTGLSATTLTPATGMLDNGVLNIRMASPGGGITGVATVLPTVVGCAVPATCYLQVTPGTATFGVYSNRNNYIYRREN